MLTHSSKARQTNHLRTIAVESFECADGTFDLELRLTDEKRFGFDDRERGRLDPGDPIHAINVRLSITSELEVLAIETDLEAMPFTFCNGAAGHTEELLGKRLDSGWRASVRAALGSTRGCAHLAELLCIAPTAALQSTAITRADADKPVGRHDHERTVRPFFVGGCYSWAMDSPITRTYFPGFAEDTDSSEAKDEG